MEYEEIPNLWGDDNFDKLPRFITKNWIEVFDQSRGTYNPNKQVRFITPHSRSDLCDYNSAYILVAGKISITNPDDAVYDRKLTLKNNAPFFNCVGKIYDQLINDANDVVIPMYDLLFILVIIIEKQLVLLGTITEMNQIQGIITVTEIEYTIELKILLTIK